MLLHTKSLPSVDELDAVTFIAERSGKIKRGPPSIFTLVLVNRGADGQGLAIYEVIHNNDINRAAIIHPGARSGVPACDADMCNPLVSENQTNKRQAGIRWRNEGTPKRFSLTVEILNGCTLRQINVREHGAEGVNTGWDVRPRYEEAHVGYVAA